ncbi:hypothetical protein Tco_1089648 [Tanacetum coccineum]
MPCVTNNVVTPKVSAIAKYAIEVESISASLKNHKNIHHHYLNLLKDILDTLREIVEENRIAKLHDNAIAHACTYTKRSQELLEYVIGTCPKAFNKRDKYIATTSSTRKNIPSTKVNSDTKASWSKPRSNIKNDRTLTAKSVPKKKVEDHIRNTKSDLHKQNHVDSSISLKRTKATGKLFANVGYQWKPTRRKFTLGELCPFNRITKPKVVHVRQWKPTGRIFPLGEQCPVTRSIASTSACRIDRPVIFGLKLFTTYEIE